MAGRYPPRSDSRELTSSNDPIRDDIMDIDSPSRLSEAPSDVLGSVHDWLESNINMLDPPATSPISSPPIALEGRDLQGRSAARPSLLAPSGHSEKWPSIPAERTFHHENGPQQDFHDTRTPPSPGGRRSPQTTIAEGNKSEKRYLCVECGKTFYRASSLSIHLNAHAGTRPYACQHPGCARTFNVKSNMLRHMRMHPKTTDEHSLHELPSPSRWSLRSSSSSRRRSSVSSHSSRHSSPSLHPSRHSSPSIWEQSDHGSSRQSDSDYFKTKSSRHIKQDHGDSISIPSRTWLQGGEEDNHLGAKEDAPANRSNSGDPESPTRLQGGKRRTRALTTPHQSTVLHTLLAQTRFPTMAMREEVGRSIGLSARKVQIWFQNQRQKARRPPNQSPAPVNRPPQFEPSTPGMSPQTGPVAGPSEIPESFQVGHPAGTHPSRISESSSDSAHPRGLRLPPLLVAEFEAPYQMPSGSGQGGSYQTSFDSHPMLSPLTTSSPRAIFPEAILKSVARNLDRRPPEATGVQDSIDHTSQKGCKCKRCDKMFSSESNLLQHSRVHNSSLPSLNPLEPPEMDNISLEGTPSIPRSNLVSSYTDPLDRNSILCLDGCVTRLGNHAVGCGGYADVWEGLFESQKVAIKVLRPFTRTGGHMDQSKLLKRLGRECAVWASLSHPNILQFLGFSYDFCPEPYDFPCLISPWMSHGTLHAYLSTHPTANRLAMINGIAKGISYLHFHTPIIIHGDIRAGNILVSEFGTPCLGDFGLSRILEAEFQIMTTTSGLAGSLRWMSPELIREDSCVSISSDVWAFGMTILEVLSGKHPYYDLTKDVYVFGRVKDGMLPSRPSAEICNLLSDDIWAICNLCWTKEPTERPSIWDVMSRLSALQSV